MCQLLGVGYGDLGSVSSGSLPRPSHPAWPVLTLLLYTQPKQAVEFDQAINYVNKIKVRTCPAAPGPIRPLLRTGAVLVPGPASASARPGEGAGATFAGTHAAGPAAEGGC